MTRFPLLTATGAAALAGPALAHADHTPHVHSGEVLLISLIAVGAMYATYRYFWS